MRPILFLMCFVLVSFNSYGIRGEEALTIKQQLDRITQEINDLNKAVFNRSFDPKNINSNNNDQNNSQDVERFASIDLRIRKVLSFVSDGSDSKARSCNARIYGMMHLVFAALTAWPCKSGQPSAVRRLLNFKVGKRFVTPV